MQILISYLEFPERTSFDIPNIALPGEVEFRESTKAFQRVEEIVGKLSRKSDESLEDGFGCDVNLKPTVPVSQRNLSVEETTKMMKKRTRVRRGRDWDGGNTVMILSQ